MRYYEALFIVHPNYEQDRLKAVVDSVETEIVKRDGVMINKIDMGKRRLAYAINKQKMGTYVLFHFEAEPAIIRELTSWMEIQSYILSQIIVKLEEKPEVIEKDRIEDSEESVRVANAEAVSESAPADDEDDAEDAEDADDDDDDVDEDDDDDEDADEDASETTEEA